MLNLSTNNYQNYELNINFSNERNDKNENEYKNGGNLSNYSNISIITDHNQMKQHNKSEDYKSKLKKMITKKEKFVDIYSDYKEEFKQVNYKYNTPKLIDKNKMNQKDKNKVNKSNIGENQVKNNSKIYKERFENESLIKCNLNKVSKLSNGSLINCQSNFNSNSDNFKKDFNSKLINVSNRDKNHNNYSLNSAKISVKKETPRK